ncbi:MAG: primosomal protein N' [Nitrospirae bacterium]|nr:MAG: primosomal protein N' [Nitrospirota bacterium]
MLERGEQVSPLFVLQSPMKCYDILFPLAIGPLTYLCPDELAHKAEPGMLVSAPVRNKIVQGILLSKNADPPAGPLKQLADIHGETPALSKGMLRLLAWMSDYYIAKPGVILKQTVPAELFERTKQRGRKDLPDGGELTLPEVRQEDLLPVTGSVSEKKYRTFLLHSPSDLYEYAAVASLLQTATNAVVVVPEIARAETLFHELDRLYPGRVCMLHSDMARGRRSEYMEGILSGKYDIVVGTRMALFAPLKKVSLIALLHEPSSFYKMEEGILYHVRDAAVMRGFFEKTTVLLSSVSPSIDSYYNALSGKYTLIRPEADIGRPRPTIVDMRFSKKASPAVSKEAAMLAGSRLRAGKNVMFVINRKGYSSLLCRECENTEACPDCSIPLVMYKEEKVLRCTYCGKKQAIPLLCSRCRSPKLEPIGSGTERIQEQIEGLLKTTAVRFDSDLIKKRTDVIKLLETIKDGQPNLLIGTKLLTTHLTPRHMFSLVVVLNIDASMNFPDFRATEKTYMELASIREHIEPGGSMIIQTRAPGHYLLTCFKNGEYQAFVSEELRIRRSLLFPPFSRFLNIKVSGRTDISGSIAKATKEADAQIDVLGPVEGRDRKRGIEISLLLKSADRKALNRVARKAIGRYEGRRDVRITIDVDPV